MKKEVLFLVALITFCSLGVIAVISDNISQWVSSAEDGDAYNVLDMNYDERVEHIRYLSDELRKLRGYVYSDPSGYGYLNRILYIQTEIQLFQYADDLHVHHGKARKEGK